MEKVLLNIALGCLFLAVLFTLHNSVLPPYYCAKSGGVYYLDGKCHIIEDIDICIQDNGAIRQKTIIDKMYVEITFNETQ